MKWINIFKYHGEYIAKNINYEYDCRLYSHSHKLDFSYLGSEWLLQISQFEHLNFIIPSSQPESIWLWSSKLSLKSNSSNHEMKNERIGNKLVTIPQQVSLNVQQFSDFTTCSKICR